MTWQRYIDELMIESDGKKMASAGIIGHEGVLWAHSANFPIKFKSKEIVEIMEAFESPRKLVRKGLHIGGTKYEVTNVEEEHVINGNKGTGGIVVKKTSMTLLVGIYNEPMTPTCNARVKRVASLLNEQGY